MACTSPRPSTDFELIDLIIDMNSLKWQPRERGSRMTTSTSTRVVAVTQIPKQPIMCSAMIGLAMCFTVPSQVRFMAVRPTSSSSSSSSSPSQHLVTPRTRTVTVCTSRKSVTMGPIKESEEGLLARFGKLDLTNESSTTRTEVYTPIEPNSTGFLQVSDTHALYWEESGNVEGQPIVFLHGGPGGGTSGGNRRFFDPGWYRIILFDQRGAGKSTPHACLEENTTWDLVNDIEKLREHLKIEKWQVFGGSWGSTLALAYSQSHPERVLGIILRGIFLLRKKEIDWFYQGGASAIYADAWEPYRDHIPAEERDDFVTAYSKRLNSTDESVQLAAAKAWTNWEMATSYLVPDEGSLKRGENDKFALAFARVENHYFRNKGFFPTDSFLLDNIDKIRHIPTVIVQGRYDVVCPMVSAWDLHRAWPEADFRLVTSAGHSANEPGITSELVAACELHKALAQKQA